MSDHREWTLLLSDETRPAERDEALRHLRNCPACKAELAAADPSRLFGLLALEPVPAGLLDRLSDTVAEGIAEPSAARGRRPLLRGWASVAASLLLAGAFSTYLLDRVDRETPAVEPELAAGPAIAEDVAEQAFELIGPRETARWVDLSVGGERFVMIFDEGLDL